jgi:hypothetical protein
LNAECLRQRDLIQNQQRRMEYLEGQIRAMTARGNSSSAPGSE